MMIRLVLIVLCVVSLSYAETKKIVVDLTTGSMESFTTRFLGGVPGTIDYFAAQGNRVEVAVVIHGDAYKFFVEKLENTQYGVDEKLAADQESIHKRLAEIQKKYNITFEMCQTGMHAKGILTQDIYPFVTPIKSAMIGLVKWQNAGYAYIRVP
ncbi:DsrE family protein [Sulfuricurvum sp. UBA5598]|uniref:DsrE family protein n=1 Tax=Sulfuricurvum sp. UBA5598 TaxID=1947586 RepID=UPI0025F8AC28|nr:DsrE family protein [Sulfuricurvum sp. UBA5598]